MVVAMTVVLALAVGACSLVGGGSPSPSAPTKLTVGLGYIPSVQFAPFYLAKQLGYYEQVGLDVEFQNKIDPDLIALVGQGAIDVGIADGTSVIPAVSQGIPIRYLATIYGRFPSIVFSKQSAGIDTAAALKGKTLGIPGKYGSSWIMLQALLGSAGLTPDDLKVVEYPDFGQGAAVAAGAVDAATGFANNEPVQLELQGTPATVLHVDDITPLPGPGLISGAETIGSSKGAAVKAFVAQTIKAMEDVRANPENALDASIAEVPELGTDRATQAAILDATIETWAGPIQEANGLGALDAEGWGQSITYLTSLGLVPNAVTTQDVLAEGFAPGPSAAP
jgi:NitT/TauT family transport system substrate-binding protein